MAEATFAFDLHVLSTPPAFNLSQNQTLQFKSVQRFLLGRNQNLKVLFPLALHLSMNQKKSFSLPPFFAAFVNMLFCRRSVNNFFGNLQKTFCEGFLKPRCFMRRGKAFTLIPHACQQLFSLFSGNLLSGTFRERLFFRRRTRCLRFPDRSVNLFLKFFSKNTFFPFAFLQPHMDSPSKISACCAVFPLSVQC